mmetsp:Transcript_18565/g.50745  ORF Transcript_18565/g.50745 Transcript_18565/m.50745 type:complete len:129 (-) Transcript_18565:269-655(-)
MVRQRVERPDCNLGRMSPFLIGPWELTIGQAEVRFQAITMINVVTNLVEIVRVHDKSAAHVARQFENTWLARYPRPNNCVHDQGGEFMDHPFQFMLHCNGIHSRATTAKNPQANAVCERVHQSIGNTL